MRVEGDIVNILFSNEENGYTVAQLKMKTEKEPVCVVGTLPQLRLGEQLICDGRWIDHKKFGRQFEVQTFQVLRPQTKDGMRKYLGGGWIKGVGPKSAEYIVDAFGIDTFDILESEPERLKEVKKLNKKLIPVIQAAWIEQYEARDIIIFLQSYEIPPNFARKIYKEYGKESIAKIRTNPYLLARDMIGVSFVKADEIAKNMQMSVESLQRVESGILYMLQELAAAQGHTTVMYQELLSRATSFLKIEESLVTRAMQELLIRQEIHIDNLEHKGESLPFVWLYRYYAFEKNIVDNLERLRSAKPIQFFDWKVQMKAVAAELKIELAAQQAEAVKLAITNKIHIITGSAGTGKSTIINVLLRTWQKYSSSIFLAAPTGRAAKRLQEITQVEAKTLHTLLGLQVGEIQEDFSPQLLEVDVLIVDEASMIDSALFMMLLKGLPTHAHLVLVGDTDQLPSVGAGNVLHDLIESKTVAVTRLTEIFRQAAESDIIRYAHQIKSGIVPNIVNTKGGDCFFLEQADPDAALQLINQLITQRLPKTYGFDPLKDIQVISPMNKGRLGTRAINAALQKSLNPNCQNYGMFFDFGDQRYAVGDKVIQTRNNSEKGIFNGDIGYIRRIDNRDGLHWVNFEGREVEFKRNDCMDLDLAYAISVHKYQGSESPAVVLLLHEAHYMLLYRNLLYTAITRGKRLVLLVGTQKALAMATYNNESRLRHTGLKQLLQPNLYQRFPAIRLLPALGAPDYEAFIIREKLA
jgi:exodeoxyribonuclease V alpha subunit